MRTLFRLAPIKFSTLKLQEILHLLLIISKEIFTLPEAHVHEDVPVMPGLDGNGIHSNHIPLFLPEKKLRKMIMKITTKSRPPEEQRTGRNYH